MRRQSIVALVEMTMSEVAAYEGEQANAQTVFVPDKSDFAEDMTEVNLDLDGALESSLEGETRIAAPAKPKRGFSRNERAPLIDFAKVEIRNSTVNIRAHRPEAGRNRDLGPDDLPEIPASEYLSLPAIDDLRLPRQSFAPRFAMTIPVEKPTINRHPGDSVRIVLGSPVIAMHEEKLPDLRPRHTTFWWASAILLLAATIIGAWSLRADLLELIKL